MSAPAEIRAILRRLAGEGVAIVVIPSELPELIGLCDRVLVVCEGRIADELASRRRARPRS